MTDQDKPPEGLKDRGLRFWQDVAEGFELAVDERQLLVEVARQLDLVEELHQQVQRDGLMSSGSQGQPVLHPAIEKLQGGRQLVGRLLAQLGLPDEDDEPSVVSPATARARKAAETRWSLERDRQNRPLGGRGGRRGA